MGALLGLGTGFGLILVWRGWRAAERPPSRGLRRSLGGRATRKLSRLIASAGLEAVTPGRLLLSCAGLGLVVGVLFAAMTKTWPVSVAFAAFAGYAPIALVRYRARIRRRELRECWPDAVDNLASSVRAGLSLPEAITQLGTRGPHPLRRAFQRFGQDYRTGGRFHDCLDSLKARLADPTGDRVVESLRMARDVGGTDLGHVLRTLSVFLRDDGRTRAELETRQGWVINAARLAVAAPWVLLALISLRSSSIQAFQSPVGAVVLASGAGLCGLAYRLMLRAGRLPEEERVLR